MTPPSPYPSYPYDSDALPTLAAGGVDLLSRGVAPGADSGAGSNAAGPERRVAATPGSIPPESGPPPSRPSEGGDQFPTVDGFTITARLGAGGMGTVWRAKQHSTRREVALKLLSLSYFGSERARRRFEREVELASRLQHPHIARVYDSGVCQGVCYYAMELIDGAPLDEYVRIRRLSPRQVVALVRAVCLAIDHAHRLGVIHRDLKPSNILVDSAGSPHLLDFGLAKSYDLEDADSTISVEGDLTGTPAYMSPEQAACRNDLVGTRSDVYSLGVILYRLLTGQSPHDLSGNQCDVLRRISDEDAVPPRKAAPYLDRELEAILLKALARQPDRRYSSAAALAEDLGNYLANEPLAARAPSTFYFLRKRLRKHLAPVAAAASVVVLAGVLGTYHFLRLGQERDHAVASSLRADQALGLARVRAIDLAYAHLGLGDGLIAAGRWGEAADVYEQSDEVLSHEAAGPFAPALCLSDLARVSPVPLATLEPPAPKPAAACPVKGVALADDGRRVGALRFDGGWQSWSLDGSAPDSVVSPSARQPGTVMTASVAPDGRWAAVVLNQPGVHPRVALWDLGEGREAAQQILPGTLKSEVALSSDGNRVVFATAGGAAGADAMDRSTEDGPGNTLWLWDVLGGKMKPLKFAGWDGGSARRLIFSPDGGKLFAVDDQGAVRVCDLSTGRAEGLGPLPGPAIALAADDGGRTLLTADAAGNVGTWDVLRHARGAVFRRKGGPAVAVALSLDGARAASAGADGSIEVRDLGGASGPNPAVVFNQGARVTSLAFSTDNRLLLSGDETGRVRAWNLAALGGLRTPATVAAIPGGFPGDYTSLALSPDGRQLFAADNCGRVYLCDCATGQVLHTWVRNWPVVRVAFSPDGATARVADVAGTFADIDVKSRKLTLQPEVGRYTWAVDLGRDGRTALVGRTDGVQLIDVPAGKELHALKFQRQSCLTVALSPAGETALCSDYNGNTTCIDVVQWRVRWTVKTFKQVRAMAFTSDGGRVVMGTEDGMLVVVDGVTGQVTKSFSAHGGPVTALVPCPDGRTVMSACKDDGAVRLWDLNAGRLVHEVSRTPAAPRCLLVAPDGGLAACGGDGRDGVWLWGLHDEQHARDRAGRAESARRALATACADPKWPEAAAARELGAWYAARGAQDLAAPLLERAAGAPPAGQWADNRPVPRSVAPTLAPGRGR